jgi:hypothetical protein
MQRLLVIALLLFAVRTIPAAESVQVGLEFGEREFVPGEAIEAKVVIVNFSGQPIRTGEWPGWLTLVVRSDSRTPFAEKQPVDFVLPFTVPQGKEVKRHINLGDYFAFHHSGSFSIIPGIRWGRGETEVQAGAPARFAIVQPATILEQPFGVVVGPAKERRTRLYTVQRLTRGRTQAFVRVSDQESGAIIGLVNMGEIVSFARRVDLRLNRINFLHVLHQSGAREYRHHVISPEGSLVARETYLSEAGRPPRLERDTANIVHVIGGRPHPQPDDKPLLRLPPPSKPDNGSGPE